MSLHLSPHHIHREPLVMLLPVVCVRIDPLVRLLQLQPRLLQLLTRYPILVIAALQHARVNHPRVHPLRRHHQGGGAHRQAVAAVGLPRAPELAVGLGEGLELMLLDHLRDAGADPEPGLDLVGVRVP